MSEKPVTNEEPSLSDLRRQLNARKAVPDVETITADEVRQAHVWLARWNSLRYLAIAFRRLILWILGIGIGLSAFVDAVQKLIGAGSIPK